MEHYFPDKDNLVWPIKPLGYYTDISKYKSLFTDLDYKEGFKVLNTTIRGLGENIPPLINIYMGLSPSMKTFGTALNDEFGEVEETGILITIDDIFEHKKERYVTSFERDNKFGNPKSKDVK